jgi:hypothetical protein
MHFRPRKTTCAMRSGMTKMPQARRFLRLTVSSGTRHRGSRSTTHPQALPCIADSPRNLRNIQTPPPPLKSRAREEEREAMAHCDSISADLPHLGQVDDRGMLGPQLNIYQPTINPLVLENLEEIYHLCSFLFVAS